MACVILVLLVAIAAPIYLCVIGVRMATTSKEQGASNALQDAPNAIP